MATTTNSAGVAHAHALVAAGKINDGAWDFTAEDGNKLLGPNGDDWANYAKWFLALHPEADPKTKAHYGYPFGKDGEIYKNAVASAKGRAAQQGATAIEGACSSLMDAMGMGSAADKPAKAADIRSRAYSRLDVKAVQEDAANYVITGVASTPVADRMGDVVEPMGAKFQLPMPLLWQHQADKPVGLVTFAKPTKSGIPFTATLPKVAESGALRDRIEEAVQSMRYKLVAAVSIGFQSVAGAVERLADGGLHFLEWDWLELSLVTIPANAEATIQTIKSLDIKAASGRPVVSILPGVSGAKPKPTEAPKMKTVQEQIQGFEATRQAKAARMTAIMDASGETGSTLDETQTEEYDTLKGEVGEKAEKVDTNPNNERRDPARTPHITIERNVPKGTAFVRSIQALLRAKGNMMMAAEIARSEPAWANTPEVAAFWKTAVAAGTTSDSAFAGPLAPFVPMQNEFIDLLRPTLLIGRIAGLRPIPFMVSMPRQTAGASAGWVGEGTPKPVSKQAFETIKMPPTKIAVITVITDELARYSTPSAEMVIQNDLLKSIQQYQDQQFIDPTVTASANVRPASITNGTTNFTISGVTIAAITADINKLIGAFITANLYPEAGAFVMHPRTAQFLGTLRTTQDILAFPGINMMGGTFFGFPVYTSTSVPIDTGDDAIIVLMDASEIFIAEDGGIELDVSREATIQMNTAPDNPPSASTVQTSLWQENLVGLRSEHRVGWLRRRDAGVAYLKGVSY